MTFGIPDTTELQMFQGASFAAAAVLLTGSNGRDAVLEAAAAAVSVYLYNERAHAQKGSTGNFSPVPGAYYDQDGNLITVTAGFGGTVSEDGTTFYDFDSTTGRLINPMATVAAKSVCPSCYLVGSGGLLRAIFGGGKSAFVTVTSWAPAGTTADLAAGRWVMIESYCQMWCMG